MSMSTHVTGFAPADGTWQKMKAAWDACETAGVPVPAEVEEFFGGEAGAGYEIDVAAIPPHVTTIRFYNSW